MHVTSDAIVVADPALGAGIVGDKAHSMVFDNAKIRSVVPAFSPPCASPTAPGRSSSGTTPTRRARWSMRAWTRCSTL
ncbi:hypothetical protein Q0F99_18095 [Rathayibacter oskolensis]|uniref:hypothetical protein n=1 Tax=Rathayibacter oskolensis TaxID=1891671 RepID=UPI00265D816B|nr:hypothetical protein [Rathayibacter oskolensis]WKK71330.1 hypothetical protein Q0F99_18095 [Rathayibacter oskolensis]